MDTTPETDRPTGLADGDASSERTAYAATPAAVYEAQYVPMVRLAYLLAGSREQAEDAVQDVFAKMIRRWDRIDDPTVYLKWSVVNACRDTGRRRAVQKRFLSRWRPEPAVPPPDDPLADAVRRLPPRQRAVVVLRYYLSMTGPEIAELMKCPLGTVKSLNYRALAGLKQELADVR